MRYLQAVLALIVISIFPLFSLSAAAAPLDDIKAFLRKMHHASVSNSEKQFLACYAGPKGYEETLKGALKYVQAVYAFDDSLIKRFGPDGRQQFDAIHLDQNIELDVPPRDDEWIEELEITIDGDKAFYMDPFMGGKVEMRRLGKNWKISLENLKTEKDTARMTRLYSSMTTLVENATKDVNAGKQPLKEIKAAMTKQLFALFKAVNDEARRDAKPGGAEGKN